MFRHCEQLFLTLATLLSLAWPQPLAAQSGFSDDFEAATFNAFWTVTPGQGGGVGLCTGQNHTPGGKQSACFTAQGVPGQKTLVLQHQFGSPTQGDFSVWFYDSGQTYYNFLYLSNSTAGYSLFVGTQDFDPSCYAAALDTSGGRIGPNANCGPFPQLSTTNVQRAPGWHKLEINVATSSLSILIDRNQVLNVPGSYSFNLLALELFGPEATPSTTYFDDFSFNTGCQVNPANVSPSPRGPYSLDGKPTTITATFVPGASSGNPVGLTAAAAVCGFESFDWQQSVDVLPSPSPFFPDVPSNLNPANLSSNRSLQAGPPSGAPSFDDPPLSGYTYQFLPGSVWPLYQPNFATASPFYYSPSDLPSGCAEWDPSGAPCKTPISDAYTLNFFDSPKDSCIFGGKDAFTAACDFTTPLNPALVQFTTRLVGVCGSSSSAGCASPGTPSAPLYQWRWESNFNGSSLGGVAEIASGAAPPPGSGTGGITITSINGVTQTPPNVSCTATPSTLWPPNGKSVSVTVSGNIVPGTSALVSGGASYAVVDEYSQVQPSGNITAGPGGSYLFGVALIAARAGSDQDGRRYTIIVTAKDTLGNVGSCAAVVTVPHDQGH